MVGTVAGERHMPSPLEVMEGIARKGEQVLLFGGQGGHAASTSVHGYFYFVRLLPQPTVTNHYVKVVDCTTNTPTVFSVIIRKFSDFGVLR